MAEAIKTESFVCPSCGGHMKWNIKKQAFECESCRTPGEADLSGESIIDHPLDEYAARDAGGDAYPDETYAICRNCGSEIAFSKNETATVCPMCGSPQVDAQKQMAGVPPDGLVPFKVDKADAQDAFKKWVKSRWFAPNKLKESYQQGKLSGVYLPFWTYDSHTEAHYWGEGGTYYEEEDDEGNTTTHTDWTPVSGYVSADFNDIPVCDGSERTQDVVEGILPYSTEAGASVYNPAFLAGVGAEHYDKGAANCFPQAEEQMERTIRSLAEDDITHRKGYDTASVNRVEMEHHNLSYKHLLLPAWVSAFAYGGKEYTYMINGETGQVSGKRPYSVPKIVAAVIAGLLALFLIYNIFIKDADAKEYVYPQTSVSIVETQAQTATSSAFSGDGGLLMTTDFPAA